MSRPGPCDGTHGPVRKTRQGERPALPHLEAYARRLAGFPGYVRHIQGLS